MLGVLGDGHGAGVYLQSEELVRIDCMLIHLQKILVLAQALRQIQDLAFQALHMLHGDIKEIAGAAGRV